MNAELLLVHYEKIADAPDAIARLRRFILDLAVRGKLVPQDPKDEPALELLKRIGKEKAGLVGLRKVRKAKAPREVVKPPFECPLGWTWARLSDVTQMTQGFAFGSGDFSSNPDDGLPLIKIGDIGRDRPEVFIKSVSDPVYIVNPGDLLLGLSGSIKCAVWKGPRALLNQRIARIKSLSEDFDQNWLFLSIDMNLERWRAETSKFTVQNIKAEQLNSAPIAVPPLAEQCRIVTKVDELMALCDRIEESRTAREVVRDRLAAASLARLKTPDLETFQADARFALDALSTLTTRPDQIKQLRQTILNLAMRGKLVPQDSAEEPASELLERIAAENKTLMAAKGIRAQKPASPAENLEAETEVPLTWRQVYLQDIAYQITDGTHLTPRYTETGKPFLSAQNVKSFRFMPERHKYVSDLDFANYRANRRPERGDILMTRVGAGIGEAAVLDSDFEFAFYVSLCLIKVPIRLVSPNYLVLWLNSPDGRQCSAVRTYGKGASQGNLNLGLIRTFKIPLPPLSEQHRIVAKVNELMALCDRLEASLTTAADTRRRLLEALLAEALAPAEERELEAAE